MEIKNIKIKKPLPGLSLSFPSAQQAAQASEPVTLASILLLQNQSFCPCRITYV
jgi:hypothetical protein